MRLNLFKRGKKLTSRLNSQGKDLEKEPLSKKNLNEQQLRQLFVSCADVHIDPHRFGSTRVLLFYCDGLTDIKQLNQDTLPQLKKMVENDHFPFDERQDQTLELVPIQHNETFKKVTTEVFSGNLVLFFPDSLDLYTLNIANPPHRDPDESSTEQSIKGPRDGFTEELTTNVALVRKRLNTSSLHYESFEIGKRSHTKVALLYIDDIISSKVVDEARKRLKNITIDVLDGGPALETMIADSSYSLFPLVDYTGRPDYVVKALTTGRFAILVNGSPIAVLAPTNLMVLLKSPEDFYTPYYMVTLQLFLRHIALILAIFLPGFWVSLTAYNTEQLPFPLLATVTTSRIGIPLPIPLEAFLMVGLFEIFTEAGQRLPKVLGQTVAVVGGLIIGDMAVRAGMVSVTNLVIVASTAIATYTLVNYSLAGTVAALRLFVLILSSFFGMFGFFVSLFAIVTYTARLESFGVPYLAPLSPPVFKDILDALINKPKKSKQNRPDMLPIKDRTRR